MKCSNNFEFEVSKDVISYYNFTSKEDRLNFIIQENDGRAPLFSNSFFRALGGTTSGNKVVSCLYSDLDDYLSSPPLDLNKVEVEEFSSIKYYALDGIFTTLTSLIPIDIIFRSMRKDKNKLELVFCKIEEDFLEFLNFLISKGALFFSYADPTALPNILGQHFDTWIVNRLVNLLNTTIKLGVFMHICPTLFNELHPHFTFKELYTISYQDEFLKGSTIFGGNCIKSKKASNYYILNNDF